MNNILIRILIFIISSFSVITLIYFQIKIIHLQQIILLLVIALVIILRTLKQSTGKKATADLLLIFIVTFFVQLLITSTGAVFSPFLIIIHLYVIGLSLIFDFWTALAFLVLEIIVMYLNIRLDQRLFEFVRQDFGSVLLYFSSILIVTPISKLIAQQYHFKADSLKNLFKELSVKESVLEQIDDFVFTTDKNLAVLQVNDAAKKIVNLSKKNELLTDLIHLVDEKGNRLTKESLFKELSPLLQKGTADAGSLNLIIKNYTLKIPNRKISPEVIIKVNPIINKDQSFERIIFLIVQMRDTGDGITADNKLKEAHKRYNSISETLEQIPAIANQPTADLNLQLLKKYEQDILTVSEFNLRPFSLKIKMADILGTLAQAFQQNQQLAKKLNIDYQLDLPEYLQEKYSIRITDGNLSEHLAPSSNLFVATDSELLQILIKKTLNIVTAIVYTQKQKADAPLRNTNALVGLKVSASDDCIKLSIQTKINSFPEGLIQKFLDIDSGSLEVLDDLALSSSLESYIIKNITDLLDISFTTEYNQYSHQLTFNISINKYFNNSLH